MPSIREVTIEDVPDLVEIIRAAFLPVADRFGLTPDNCPTHPSNCTDDWIHRDLAKGVRYFILSEASDVRGCVAVERADAGTCYLERLAVRPECQKNGYGRLLVEHVMETARIAGALKVGIAIIAEHHDLLTWYERLGFTRQETKTFPQLPFQVLFMQRPVD